MKSKTIGIEITDSDTLEFNPLSIHKNEEDAQYTVGVPASGSYLVVSEVGLRAIRLFNQGLSAGSVKQRMEGEIGTDNLTLSPLLSKLLAAGMVRRVGTQMLKPHSPRRTIFAPDFMRTPLHIVFSTPAVSAYIIIFIAALGCALFRGRCLLTPTQILAGAKYSHLVMILLLLGFLNTLRHEMAHVLAAWHYGVGVRVSVGHRFIFLVLQTDLTDLWGANRRARFVAYSAGIVSDLLTLAVITLAAHGFALLHTASPWPELSKELLLLSTLSVIVIWSGLLWHFNVFVRTDLYFILCAALNCRNLHADATRYLVRIISRILRRKTPADSDHRDSVASSVRVYASLIALGYTLCSVFLAYCVVNTYRVLRSSQELSLLAKLPPIRLDISDKAIMLVSLLLPLLLVGYSKYKEMSGRPVIYQLRERCDS